MSAAPKTILLVDDDAQFLEILQSLAQTANGEAWTVLTAQSTAEALKLLEQRHIDLVVVDLRMPVIDGVQFLQLIQRKYPQLKKIILSGHLDGSSRTAASQAGAELVLEKPLAAEGFQSLLAALGELMRWQNEQGFRGVLRRVGLEDIIQMECLSRHSAVFEVRSPDARGRLFIRKGELVHAEFGDAVGEPALQQLLALTGGEFQHATYSDPPRRTLEGSWEFLLMEAVRHRDEAAAGISTAAAEPEPEPKPTPDSPAPRAKLPGVSELVVCGTKGDILDSYASANPASRATTVTALASMAKALAPLLPVGDLERVEFLGGDQRMVARFSQHGAVFVRGTIPPK